MKKYTNKEYEGLLLWCLGLLIDDMQSVVKTFPNHKPLDELTDKEFVIENADMGLGIVEGQLEDMGIDSQKLVANTAKRYDIEPEEILNLSKIES